MSSFRQLLRAYRLLPGQIVRLDPELFDRLAALAKARGVSVEALVVEVLYTSARDLEAQTATTQRWELLTPREQQVAALACLGYTNEEIANGLVISINTVRSHMRNILDKYEVSSKAELRVSLSSWDFAGWADTE
jgi:DNA-binding CsgD family transcriptional regulator